MKLQIPGTPSSEGLYKCTICSKINFSTGAASLDECTLSEPPAQDDQSFFDFMTDQHCPNKFCIVCYDSVRQNDPQKQFFTNEDGCRRCCPCTVCFRCSAHMPFSKHDENMPGELEYTRLCLDCVKDDEICHLPNRKQQRQKALAKWKEGPAAKIKAFVE